jgi:hypothetical protein
MHDRFAGSTLQVMGLIAREEQGEWSIVGGTRDFRMAQGFITYRTDQLASTWEDGVRELDITIIQTAITTQNM